MAIDLSKEISPVMNLLNLLKFPRGSVTIKSNGQPAFSLQFKSDNILLDIIDASFFEFADDTDSVGLISKIKNRKNNLHNSLLTTA